MLREGRSIPVYFLIQLEGQLSREGAYFAFPNMLFIAIGSGPTGAVRHEHSDGRTAVDTAIRLLGEGFKDVQVIAPDGRIYQPVEFYQLLNERGKFDV
jgi:hypothetical protein